MQEIIHGNLAIFRNLVQNTRPGMGVTVQTYRRLERNPELLKVKDIQVLSEYLNMPLRDFLFIPDDGKK